MSLEAQLTRLEDSQLVRRLGGEELAYLFKHALTQESAYQMLLLRKRRELHGLVAQAYEQVYPERLDEFAALLAHHYGEAGDDERTLEYAIRAGDAAARLYAYPEARAHYALALKALERLPDDDDNNRRRVDTTLKMVSVSLRAEGPEATLARLSQAESLAQALTHPESFAADRLRLARLHYWMGHAHIHRNEPREAIGYLRQVLAVAQETGDPELLAFPASVIGRTVLVQGQFGQAAQLLTEAIAALEKTSDEHESLLNDEHEWILAVGFRGVAFAARGEYTRGVSEAKRALERALKSNTPTGISLGYGLLGLVHWFGGDHQRVLESVDAMIDVATQSGDRLYLYIGNSFAASAQTRLGQYTAAASSFERAKAIAQSMGGRAVFADWVAAFEAEFALRTRPTQVAIALAEQVVATAQSINSLFSAALAHRVWGCALAALEPPRWEEAESHLAASLHALESGQAYVEVARTHVAWGKLLRERGEWQSAREHLERAAAQFEASGLERELDETRELMREFA